MGRRKKEPFEVPEKLTELQVQNIFDVYNYALQWNDNTFKEFSQATGNPYLYPAVYNPMLLNQRMQSITLAGRGAVTTEKAEEALLNPSDSEDKLLEYSEILEYSNPSYKRILTYLGNLPSWDYTFWCKNISKPSDYTSASYKKALDVVKNFMGRFDVKSQMPVMMRQLLRQETFFSVLRDEGERYVLQELPGNYCLITGRFDYGMLFSFNYYYFLQQGIDIDLYPDIFKRTYLRLFKGNGIDNYNPSANIDYRSGSTWVMYGDCAPSDGFWMWKFSPELVCRIPQFASLFPDLAMLPTVRALQKNAYLVSSAKVLFTELPFLKDTKATVKDATALSPKILGQFMALVQALIDGTGTKFIEAPVQNAKGIEFNHDNTLLSSYSRNVLSQSGTTSNLISNFDQKMNTLESELAANVDEQLVESIYPSCNAFMEYQINTRLKKAGLPQRFGFNFEGTNFFINRQRRLDTQVSLLGQGIVMPQKIAAAIGMSPFEMQAHMEEAKAMGWVDGLTPVIPGAQQSLAETGRPSKPSSELSEGGEATRASGSNRGRGGKM